MRLDSCLHRVAQPIQFNENLLGLRFRDVSPSFGSVGPVC